MTIKSHSEKMAENPSIEAAGIDAIDRLISASEIIKSNATLQDEKKKFHSWYRYSPEYRTSEGDIVTLYQTGPSTTNENIIIVEGEFVRINYRWSILKPGDTSLQSVTIFTDGKVTQSKKGFEASDMEKIEDYTNLEKQAEES